MDPAIFAPSMHPRDLSIADWTYALPEDRIAQRPLEERDASKLLIYAEGSMQDGSFRDLPDHLPDNALLVLNDTRVVNARILFERITGARIEVLCLDPADGAPLERAFDQRAACEWHCFIGNAKRWKAGEDLVLRSGPAHSAVQLIARRTGPERVAFRWEPAELSFAEVLERVGHVPLPPYMKRPDDTEDKERYNTVFARNEGSVAAPTASLHFTPYMIERAKANGAAIMEVTLHVGAGTFLPVKSERMEGHAMHAELVRIPLAALEMLAERLGKGPIVPVGTTALRTLESVYWHGAMLLQGRAGTALDVGQWEPYEHTADELPSPSDALSAVIDQLRSRREDRLVGRTSLLIAPGYSFRYADALVTNFHQPQSTLLLLVAAFVGADWRKIYAHALANGYRFLSYGDGSLLFRNGPGSPTGVSGSGQ